MVRLVVRVLVNAVALWIATVLLPGVTIGYSAGGGLDTGSATGNTALAYVFIGLIFGVVNALIKPIVLLLSLPVTIVTLGLFTIVINAAMLWLTSWLSAYTPVHFALDSFFWTAILAALIISVVSMLMSGLTRSARKR
ncbi:phage holin family protein [Specibacter sp. RAF43]|uniref:phage holin family protein n=1 Tax=Specibacter sp. RAF43 TaxID=3233057 RepID=UPI003F9A3234